MVMVAPGANVVTLVPRTELAAPHGPAFCSAVRGVGEVSWMCAEAGAASAPTRRTDSEARFMRRGCPRSRAGTRGAGHRLRRGARLSAGEVVRRDERREL